MSRKTRKEKMATQLRRSKNEEANKQEISKEQPKVVTYKFKLEQINSVGRPQEKYDYSSIYSDLKRISILIVLTLFFQVGINLTLRTGFAKLLLRNLGIEI